MRRAQSLARYLVWPFQAFLRTEARSAVLLGLAAVGALAWANSPYAASYEAIWSTEVTVGAPGFGLSKPLLLWINDLLMAVFFLLVGLEIKRELAVGELNTLRKAAGPALAAVGGMVVPALVFLLVAPDPPASRGWAIPMATDIAFALGCLRLLGGRVPGGLLVFLTALAIIDDLGAIVVIGLFYTAGLSATALGVALALAAGLVAMNRAGVRHPAWYLLVGLPLWVAVLQAGVHATVAGVVVGLCVPASRGSTHADVLDQAHRLIALAEGSTEEEREAALRGLERRLIDYESPVERLEHALLPWVSYGIVPLFALANAGVDLAGLAPEDLTAPTSLGIVLGLFVGKPVGIVGATLLAVRTGLASLPAGVTWRHVHGAGLLAGIGFTMALFIAGLSHEPGSPLHEQAKLAVLAASVMSGSAGLLVLASRRE